MSEDDECIHGLDKAWCATCKHGPETKEPERFEYTFAAKYDGQCSGCDLPIHLGQSAGKTNRGRVIHRECLS